MATDYSYTTQQGNTLNITVYGTFGDGPCVLYCHGFKGFKDWGFVPYAGEYFARQGICFVTFNFSHNGIGEDGQSFTELEAFSQNTFSLELSEALEMIHLCVHTDHLGRYLNDKLYLLGHSRGGGIALLAAAKSSDIAGLITWASVATFDRWDKKARQAWRKAGYHEVKNSRTGQVFQLGLDMLQDIEKNTKKSLNILNAAKELEKPWLLIHGVADESVPYYEGETLNIYANPSMISMRLIPGTGHTFGAKHPFSETNPALEQILQLSVDFVRQ